MTNEIVNSFASVAINRPELARARFSPVIAGSAGAISQANEGAAGRSVTEAAVKPTFEQVTQIKTTAVAGSLDRAVRMLNDYLENTKRELRFSQSDAGNRTIISVYDTQTDELIRQIPPNEVMRLAEALEEAKVLTSTGFDRLS
jgi:flagellar protein FlaG